MGSCGPGDDARSDQQRHEQGGDGKTEPQRLIPEPADDAARLVICSRSHLEAEAAESIHQCLCGIFRAEYDVIAARVG